MMQSPSYPFFFEKAYGVGPPYLRLHRRDELHDRGVLGPGSMCGFLRDRKAVDTFSSRERANMATWSACPLNRAGGLHNVLMPLTILGHHI